MAASSAIAAPFLERSLRPYRVGRPAQCRPFEACWLIVEVEQRQLERVGKAYMPEFKHRRGDVERVAGSRARLNRAYTEPSKVANRCSHKHPADRELPLRLARMRLVASYAVNERAVARARGLIRARQYVLDSEWGDAQPRAEDENAFLELHSWDDYAEWHLGLTDGAAEETKARYAFVYGDFRRVHRMGLIACHYRAAEWRHKEIELAAHELLQLLDKASA
jgi:hypothetical protein